MSINRRDLFKFSLVSLTALSFFPFKRIFAQTISSLAKNQAIKQTKSQHGNNWPDLVGVKDGAAAQMFEIGIQALGGMERFVKRGQVVLVKPNIGWNKTPNEGANTNPELIGAIVKKAYQAGARQVKVFDHPCHRMEDCYKNSGIEKAVVDQKGIMVPSDQEKYYRTVEIKGATLLKKVAVHQDFLDADVVINVPVLKNHSGATMTSALKNFMGVVWDRRFWHRSGLHQCIGEFSLLRKIDLTIIDAYTVMYQNGPLGISSNDLKMKKMQILSTDAVLADTAAAKILEKNVGDVPYLSIAEKLGVGSTDIGKKNIKRISCNS